MQQPTMTPADIQRLFQQPCPSFPGHDVVAAAAHDDGYGLRAQRTARLQQVLLAVQQYWIAGSPELDFAAEVLADGSRDASWRIPIGEAGLLDFFLSILTVHDLRQALQIHALRLIGNSCADEDENRARVVAGHHIGQIVGLLHDDMILAFVIPVLYNICVDYEPAQLQASQAQLSRELVTILSTPRLAQCRAFLDIICKILGLLVSLDPELQLADPATPTRLLNLAASPDIALDAEELSILLSVALSYFATERFQEELVRQDAVPALLQVLSDCHTKYDLAQLDPDEAADFQAVRSRFTHTLADVVALPSFAAAYPLTSPVVQMLQSWIANAYASASLKAAACIALGNLARSDASSLAFVHDLQIHIPLLQLLSQPPRVADSAPTDDVSIPSQLTYSVLSFLKNLAIPPANKPLLGVLLEAPASILPRIFTTTDAQPQVQFAAVSLTRLLLVSCPDNVRRICSPLSPDPSSPAHERSNLHVLTTFFQRVDAENTKTEAARAISAVCRVLHTSFAASSDSSPPVPVLSDDWEPPEEPSVFADSAPTSNSAPSSSATSPAVTNAATSAAASEWDQDGVTTSASTLVVSPAAVPPPPPPAPDQPRRVRFYAAHLDIADGLTYLMMQTRFPVLRSETWFLCALMCRSADGAHLVMRALQPFEACRALVEAISGHDMVDGHELPGTESLGNAVFAAGEGAPSAAAPDGTPPPPVSPGQRGSFEGIDTDALAAREHSLPASAPGTAAAAAAAAAAPAAPTSLAGLGLEPQQADPAQTASMARVDRENGLILVSEIMKNYAHFQPPFRRGVFEEILRTGGALVINARASDMENTR